MHFFRLGLCTWFGRRCFLLKRDAGDTFDVVPVFAFNGLIAQLHYEWKQFFFELVQVHEEFLGDLLDGQLLAGLFGECEEVCAYLLTLGHHFLKLAFHAFFLQVFEFVHFETLGLELVLLVDVAPQFDIR